MKERTSKSVSDTAVTMGLDPDVDEGACPAVREILDRVGDKWSVLVIVLLAGGQQRFTELQRNIEGISQRMLTRTLRQLERDGLVTRTVQATVPPRVDYDLTDLGRSLIAPVATLATWALDHRHAIQHAREAYDRRAGVA